MPKSKTKAPTKSKISKAALAEEIAQLKNSVEYPELYGLLTNDPHKKVATVDWLNKHLPNGEAPLTKCGAKDKERFILALIRKGKARTVINQLRDLPSLQWKTLYAQLAGMSVAKASEKLKSLSPKDFAAFCVANGITTVTSGKKNAISKPNTIPFVLKKLGMLGEYLKL